jgi:RNA-binding protein 26
LWVLLLIQSLTPLTRHQGIGEFTDIEVTPSHTSVTFKDRFTAEKFMATNGEIPSIGKVEMAWMQTPLAPITRAPFKPVTAARNGNADEDTQMEEGDAMVSTSSPAQHLPSGEHAGGDQQENLDYDVADDNDWGPE